MTRGEAPPRAAAGRPAAALLALLSLFPGACASTAERTVVFGARPDLYPRYVADPWRATMGLRYAHVDGDDGAGSSRWLIPVGQRFGVLRIHPPGEPEVGWQVAGEVAILGEFDIDNSEDNIGWDGVYGFHLARRHPGGLAWRVGLEHDSAHLGDELIEDRGRERVGYTREEVVAGLAADLTRALTVYGELGWAYHLGAEELMDPGRAQAGLELEPERTWWGGRAGWYGAADVSAFEERDWAANVGLQGGLVFHADSGAVWRVGLELYDGRSPLGEFFQEDVRRVALGFWIDL